MRISERFVASAPPEVVFDYMTDPANLSSWQTSKTLVEPLTAGPTRAGSRVRERTKPPGGREFEQIVEFTEFDRPRRSTSISSRGRTRSTEPGRSRRQPVELRDVPARAGVSGGVRRHLLDRRSGPPAAGEREFSTTRRSARLEWAETARSIAD